MRLLLTVVAVMILLFAAGTAVRADEPAPKPWRVNLGSFVLTSEGVESSSGGTLNATYHFRSLGSRRQNEDAASLWLAGVDATTAGGASDVSLAGIMYEHTWGFGSGYYAMGVGPLRMAVGGSSETDLGWVSRLGVYVNRTQTFAIELHSLAGGRTGNTGGGLAIGFRF